MSSNWVSANCTTTLLSSGHKSSRQCGNPCMDNVSEESTANVVDTLCEQICDALNKSINACKFFRLNTNFRKSK